MGLGECLRTGFAFCTYNPLRALSFIRQLRTVLLLLLQFNTLAARPVIMYVRISYFGVRISVRFNSSIVGDFVG